MALNHVLPPSLPSLLALQCQEYVHGIVHCNAKKLLQTIIMKVPFCLAPGRLHMYLVMIVASHCAHPAKAKSVVWVTKSGRPNMPASGLTVVHRAKS